MTTVAEGWHPGETVTPAGLIVLNGPIGVGKSTIARQLAMAFKSCAVLDGELVTLVRPFDPHDAADFAHAASTFRLLYDRHLLRGVSPIIVTWILENAAQCDRFFAAFPERVRASARVFLLVCGEEELMERIEQRRRPDLVEELARGQELLRLMHAQIGSEWVGQVIDTTALTSSQVVSVIQRSLEEASAARHD